MRDPASCHAIIPCNLYGRNQISYKDLRQRHVFKRIEVICPIIFTCVQLSSLVATLLLLLILHFMILITNASGQFGLLDANGPPPSIATALVATPGPAFTPSPEGLSRSPVQ